MPEYYIRLTFQQIAALPKLIRHARGSTICILSSQLIQLQDIDGREMVVRWNVEKAEYFQDHRLTEEANYA